MKDVITIDGPSGAGKGTIAKILARELGYEYLDTGALYRAVAWKAREDHVDISDEDALKSLLKSVNILFKNGKIMVNGRDISEEIRTSEIGELSSQVSAIAMVRDALFSLQREMCMRGRIVIEGRDTGTRICPESENKFYLDASLEERARRRYADLKAQDPELTLDATIRDIKRRDMRDSTRKSSPLKRTDDMVYVDSTSLSIDEVVNLIRGKLR